MPGSGNFCRRRFLKQTAQAAVGATVLSRRTFARSLGANDRLNIGVIGCGGQASGSHLPGLLAMRQQQNVDIIAVCDVFERRATQYREKVQAGGGDPKTFHDYHDLLALKDVDYVLIASPEHWHVRMTLDALAAGKHVYCEKPMTHTIQESQQVVAEVQRTGLKMQVGVQGMSDDSYSSAYEAIRAGKLGPVVECRLTTCATICRERCGAAQPFARTSPSRRIWIGRTGRVRPHGSSYSAPRYYDWRRFREYSGGIATDLFVHRITRIIRACGLGFPERVVGMGGIYLWADGRELPDNFEMLAQYPKVEGVTPGMTLRDAWHNGERLQERPLHSRAQGHNRVHVKRVGLDRRGEAAQAGARVSPQNRRRRRRAASQEPAGGDPQRRATELPRRTGSQGSRGGLHGQRILVPEKANALGCGEGHPGGDLSRLSVDGRHPVRYIMHKAFNHRGEIISKPDRRRRSCVGAGGGTMRSWAWLLCAVVLLPARVEAQILFTESFRTDVATNSAFLTQYSPPWSIASNPSSNVVRVVNGQLQVKEIVGSNTFTNVAVPGYSATTYPQLTIEGDVGANVNNGWFGVGLTLGGVVINFAPGYAAQGGRGWFKIDNPWGGGDVDGTDMGYVPANVVMHHIKVTWKQQAGQYDITITDGANSTHVFHYVWSHPSAVLAAGGSIGFVRTGPDDHQTATDGLGLFDNLYISLPGTPTSPCSGQIFADTNGDSDVDSTDFGTLQLCFSDTNGITPPGCSCFDRNSDGRVDAADADTFIGCITGADLTIDLQNPPPACILEPSPLCTKQTFPNKVDDAAYTLQNARYCWYKLFPNWWVPVTWIGSYYILNDMVDIYEYMELNQLNQLTVDSSCGDTVYTKSAIFNDIVQRCSDVLNIALAGGYDEIRGRQMIGFCEPLDSNFGPLAGKNYCWHFHNANALEPIARFISLVRRGSAPGQEPAFVQQYDNSMVTIMSGFYSDWMGDTYEEPAETRYQQVTTGSSTPYKMAYNMAGSIGIAYLYLYDVSGEEFFLQRAVSMGRFMRQAVQPGPTGYCTWQYAAIGGRAEDPDHALEDLRFAIFLYNRAIVFDEDRLDRMLTAWFNVGLNQQNACMTCSMQSTCNINSNMKMEDVCARAFFLLRFDSNWFNQCIDQVPSTCVPQGCSGCSG